MAYSQSPQEPKSAMARAAAYGLIAHGFQYPDAEILSTLTEPGRWENWPGVLQMTDGQTKQPLESVRNALRAFAGGSKEHLRELQQRYDSLFGHAVRGACPAYEMEYGRNEIIRQASDLADLAGFYRAFGLEIANDANGRPDHIAAECEFMSALCLKEAHARSQGDNENADICFDAERTFLRDHLARWLPALMHQVGEADADGLFGAFARFADAFVKAECNLFDVHAGPSTLELRTPDPVLDTQISCGSGGCGESGASDKIVQLGTGIANHEHRSQE
jgi:putative dimethyl sulfoxide reductase chaperone